TYPSGDRQASSDMAARSERLVRGCHPRGTRGEGAVGYSRCLRCKPSMAPTTPANTTQIGASTTGIARAPGANRGTNAAIAIMIAASKPSVAVALPSALPDDVAGDGEARFSHFDIRRACHAVAAPPDAGKAKNNTA